MAAAASQVLPFCECHLSESRKWFALYSNRTLAIAGYTSRVRRIICNAEFHHVSTSCRTWSLSNSRSFSAAWSFVVFCPDCLKNASILRHLPTIADTSESLRHRFTAKFIVCAKQPKWGHVVNEQALTMFRALSVTIIVSWASIWAVFIALHGPSSLQYGTCPVVLCRAPGTAIQGLGLHKACSCYIFIVPEWDPTISGDSMPGC